MEMKKDRYLKSEKQEETVPAPCNFRAVNNRVISYRVRYFDEDQYIVESYSMDYNDELRSYKESARNFHIRSSSYRKNREAFDAEIRDRCRKVNYDLHGGETEQVDRLNAFLATHYFPASCSAVDLKALEKLNEYAAEYMLRHNRELQNQVNDGPEREADRAEKLERAAQLMGNNIDVMECMNVGQANCSMGYHHSDESKPLAVFDIGVRSINRSRAYVESKLRSIDQNGVVVISHYDADHIDGYCYLPDEAAERIWILPQKRQYPTTPERILLNFLKEENCVFLDDVDYDATPFDPEKHIQKIRNISVYQGNAIKKDTNQSTDENARCLMCLVENNESMLLPGDCLYQEFPREFQVQYLAVPHHCCDYPNDIRNLTLSALKELVIFARPHRRYRHPNRTQLDRLLAVSQPQVIYLMKFDHFYFDGKREINTPPITITGEYHRISL